MNNDIRKIKEFLESTLNDMQEKEDVEYVGELPYELIKISKNIKREKDRLKEDLQLRELQLVLDVKRKLKEEFDEKIELVEKKHSELWETIYDCMMIEKEAHYFLENGSLFRVIKDDESNKKFQFTKPH